MQYMKRTLTDSLPFFHERSQNRRGSPVNGKRIKLIHILLFSFIITAMELILVIVGSWHLVTTESDESAQYRVQHMLSDTIASLEDWVGRLEDGSVIASSLPEVRDFMAGDEQVRVRLKDSVRAELEGFVYYESGAVSSYLRAADGTELTACPEESFESIVPYRVYLQVVQDYQILQPFRQQLVTGSYEVSGHRFFGVLTPLYPDSSPPTDHNYLGALILIVDADAVRDFIPDSAQENVHVEDPAGILLDNTGVRETKLAGSSAVLSASVREAGWTVSVPSRLPDPDGSVQQIVRICLFIGIGSVAFLLLMMLIQYRHIVAPIQKLTEQVDHVDPETTAVLPPERGFAELLTLSDSMNSMLRRLQQMNEQMINDRLKYYEDRITFLQAQINPHALYNNFECIRGMAAQGATDEIREMTTCLARMYRYCCKGETRVRLEEEENCLRYYRRVLELRYAGAFRIETEMAPDTMDALIPRMILQPLAENAVQHGLIAAGRKQGTVTIRSRAENGRLILTVMDDGAGMEEAALSRYNSSIALHDDGTHSHIGITNVLRRLKMIYQPEDPQDTRPLARFENRPEGGLLITIDIPLVVS